MKQTEKLASSIYLIKKANLEDFLTKHPQYADLLLRPLLGAGIGYGAHRVGELVSPSKDEEERKNNRNRSLLLGTSVGLGGALSSTLRKLHKFQEEDALSSALRKLHKFQD